MNTTFKPMVTSPYQLIQDKTKLQNKENPIASEVTKNVGVLNLSLTIQPDTQTMNLLNQSGAVAYLCTVKQGETILGQGRGLVILGPTNRYIERSCRSSYSASIIDSIVKSVKTLDAMHFTNKEPTSTKAIEITRGNEELLKPSSPKQLTFLKKLIDENCNSTTRVKYINYLTNEPRLSSLKCSQLIAELLNK